MFGSFGSVETKCNGASKEIYFQNEQPKHFDIFGRAPPITATLILDVFLYVSPTKGWSWKLTTQQQDEQDA